jgi:hypothetical protein
MKRNFWLILLVPLLFSGCGEFEWFPDNSGPFPNRSTSSNANTNATNNTATPTTPTTPAASVAPATLNRAFNPLVMLAGVTPVDPNLTFTITNATTKPAQVGLGFTHQLPTGFTATATTASQCGGTLTATGSTITFSGGSLTAGTASCNITALVTASTAGGFVDNTADFTGLAGGLQNFTENQAVTVAAAPATSVTNGTLTALDLVSSPFAADRRFGFEVSVKNTGAATVNVKVDVVAVNFSGVDIGTITASITGPVAPTANGLSTLLALDAANFTPLSVADFNKIALWRIVNVAAVP